MKTATKLADAHLPLSGKKREGSENSRVFEPLDFANNPEDILKALRTDHETAEPTAATDPNLVLNFRTKLDATGDNDQQESPAGSETSAD